MALFWKFWTGGVASKGRTKRPPPPRVPNPPAPAPADHVGKTGSPPWMPVTPADTPVLGKNKRKRSAGAGDPVEPKRARTTGNAPTGEREAVVGGKAAKWSLRPEDEMRLFEGGLDDDDDVVETTEVDAASGSEDLGDDVVHGTGEIGSGGDGGDVDELAFLDAYDDGVRGTDEFVAGRGVAPRDWDDEDADEDVDFEEGVDEVEDDEDGDSYEDIDDIPGPEGGLAADPAEEDVVYVDVEGEEEDGTSASVSSDEAETTLLDASVFEVAETDGSLVADVRARVGSFDADFVPSKLLLARGWPEDSISLVKRLHQRGHEPLFPSDWAMDFRHLPAGLFLPASAPPAKSFINSTRGKDFRATKALTRLISLGPKARDKIAVGGSPERLISAELQRYVDWASYDSRNQFPDHPLVVTHSGAPTDSVPDMESVLLERLRQVHERWDRARRPASTAGPEAVRDAPTLPTLYGVLVSHTLVGIVTFVPPAGEHSRAYLRSVGVFDFGLQGYDVWNSLALALLVCHARDVASGRGCGVQRPGAQRVSVARGLGPDPDS